MTIYLLWAAGERLVAESLEELAEIYECAIDAGDRIDRLRAVDGNLVRLLRDDEFAGVLELAYATYVSHPEG